MNAITLKVSPILDPEFQPAVLWNREFRQSVSRVRNADPVSIAVVRPDGIASRFDLEVFPRDHALNSRNVKYLERFIGFVLWSRGGNRILWDGPAYLLEALNQHYSHTDTGRFTAHAMGEWFFGEPFELLAASRQELPENLAAGTTLGRHFDGCRIGFDLGGSDRKCAALIDGEVVFTEEVPWNPYFQSDPQYHIQGISDTLRMAANRLPRVDAIGGSAAGVYINNETRFASLFRGLSEVDFETHARRIFIDLQAEWNHVPFAVMNDGEVTALAGSMALDDSAVLGFSMGTSLAGGYVDSLGKITGNLDELAFAPVDYRTQAPVDEWSQDRGCGVQYFSQQAVARLAPSAGIELPDDMSGAEQLVEVQAMMASQDERAHRIYATIGAYLGYTVAHYAEFYEFRSLLLLGRVMTGEGGNVIVKTAEKALNTEFPELADIVELKTVSETDKRHGQAVAAATLPALESESKGHSVTRTGSMAANNRG